MRGHVLGVDTRTGDGMITGDDGKRYSFRPPDWAHRGEPAVGLYVDFEAADSRALSIFPVPGAPPAPATAAAPANVRTAYSSVPMERRERMDSDRNKLVAALLAFFLGPLGVHRFYLGRVGTGVLTLVLSCTVVGLAVTIPWSIIDMIRYLIMSDREFADRYAREN
jgi:TM2 domain-containing membrane protein YozV